MARPNVDASALLALLPLAAIAVAAREHQDLPPGRCPRCRAWPDLDIVRLDTDDHLPFARECVCGFAPMLVRVVYVDQPITP